MHPSSPWQLPLSISLIYFASQSSAPVPLYSLSSLGTSEQVLVQGVCCSLYWSDSPARVHGSLLNGMLLWGRKLRRTHSLVTLSLGNDGLWPYKQLPLKSQHIFTKEKKSLLWLLPRRGAQVEPHESVQLRQPATLLPSRNELCRTGNFTTCLSGEFMVSALCKEKPVTNISVHLENTEVSRCCQVP